MNTVKLLCSVCLTLLVLSLALPVHAGFPTMSVTFINVGQGDAPWIHTTDGLDILIDGGKELRQMACTSHPAGRQVSSARFNRMDQ